MKFIKCGNDLESAFHKFNWDLDQGRSELAVLRVEDALREFPDDPHLLYAYGLMCSSTLGRGVQAFDLYVRAFNAAGSNPAYVETRWYAACNAASFAPDIAAFRYWGAKSDEMTPADQKKPTYREIPDDGDELTSYVELLLNRIAYYRTKEEYGDVAALEDIVLKLNILDEVETCVARKNRAVALRQIDRREADQHEAAKEGYAPPQRLALLGAVQEMQKVVAFDPADAEAWNFLAGWYILLERFEEAIGMAEKAIAMRPLAYPKPWNNKAQAELRLKRFDCAAQSALEACAAATASEDESERQCANSCLKYAKVRQEEPSLQEIDQTMRQMLYGASQSAAIFTKRMRTTPKALAQIIVKKCHPFLSKPDYLSIVAETLMYFPPDVAWLAFMQLAEIDGKQFQRCLDALLVLASHTEGVQQRDALRALFLCLMTTPDLRSFLGFYRRIVLARCAARPQSLGQLQTALAEEAGRWSPWLAKLIDQQKPLLSEVMEASSRDISGVVSIAGRWGITI